MISVVIHAENAERTLVPTLASLIPGAPAGLVREVIIADGGSTDATAEVADMAGCHFMQSPGPIGARLSEAAKGVRAPWLLFLRAGTVLDANWVSETARFIEVEDLAEQPRAAVFRPGADAPRSALSEAVVLIRAAFGGRPQPEQGLLIARRIYDAIGGHVEASDAEAELIRRLGRARLVMLRSGAVVARPR